MYQMIQKRVFSFEFFSLTAVILSGIVG